MSRARLPARWSSVTASRSSAHAQRARAGWPRTPPPCSRATSTISCPPSGTRTARPSGARCRDRRRDPADPGTARWSIRGCYHEIPILFAAMLASGQPHAPPCSDAADIQVRFEDELTDQVRRVALRKALPSSKHIRPRGGDDAARSVSLTILFPVSSDGKRFRLCGRSAQGPSDYVATPRTAGVVHRHVPVRRRSTTAPEA